MKNMWINLIAKTIGIVVLCTIAVIAYNNYVLIGVAFSHIWEWTTNNWFYILISSLIVGFFGFKLKRFKWYNYDLSFELRGILSIVGKKTGLALIIIGLIGLLVSIFSFFNYFEWMKIFLLVLGGLLIVAISLATIFFLDHVISKRTPLQDLWLHIVAVVGLLSFCFYLDSIVFSYQPWLTSIALGMILSYLAIVKIISYYHKTKKAKKEKEEKELKAENKKNLKESLIGLDPKFLALHYIGLKANKDEVSEELATIHFEALFELIKKNRQFTTAHHSFSGDDLADICNKIRHTNYQLGRGFLDLIAKECLENDAVELIFTSSSLSPNKLPILFANCSNKKAIIDSYLTKWTIRESIKMLLFNNVKREFKTSILIGVISILEFAYEKNSDEETLKLIIANIQSYLDFASDCLLKVRKPEEAKTLETILISIIATLDQAGIDIEKPTLNKELSYFRR